VTNPDALASWTTVLEARHLATLSFPEVSRALRALSSAYVENRGRIRRGAALSGTGKRAAFALFYGPLHYLLVRHIVSALPGATMGVELIVDLGCGTGAAGAAWATALLDRPRIEGIDRHPWAVEETRRTYRDLHLAGRARLGDASRVELPADSRVLAAFVVNELDESSRGSLLSRLLAHQQNGGHVLIVEPLAKSVTPWWKDWQSAFERRGGQSDEWRIRTELPPIVEKLDRSAGLNHREITGRSLWM
jgi:hypothetical protein